MNSIKFNFFLLNSDIAERSIDEENTDNTTFL